MQNRRRTRPHESLLEEGDTDWEALALAHVNVLTGACMALGVRFAGTADAAAYETLTDAAADIKFVNLGVVRVRCLLFKMSYCFLDSLLTLACFPLSSFVVCIDV